MRKNYINWKRQPACSFCEICCPAAVMFFMVWIRTLLTASDYSATTLELLKRPLFPGLAWDESVGNWTGEDPGLMFDLSSKMEDFMVYDNYSFVSKEGDYSVLLDYFGPLYFFPPNCKEKAFPNIPKMNTTGIALIGDSTTPVM